MKPIMSICLLAFTVCSSCLCPEGNESIPYKTFDAEFTGFVDYKPGSYWVYKEYTTGAIDSSYIISYSKTTLENSTLPDKTVNSDKLEMGIRMNNSLWLGQASLYKQNNDYIFFYHLSDQDSGIDQPVYDNILLTDKKTGYRTFRSIEHTDSIMIGGKLYSDVK